MIHMIKKKKKAVTLESLSMMVKEGFAQSDKRTAEKFAQSDKRIDSKIDALAKTVDGKIDALAGMVQRGFVGMEKRLDGMDKRMDTLEHGQEDIKLSLNNVAYRFELKRLEERVDFLERKIAKA